MDDPAIPPPPSPEQQAAMAAAAAEFNRELWILLAIGATVTFLRLTARIRNVGITKLQADDYLVLLALLFYGIESGLAYSVGAHAQGLANNGMTEAHRAALPTDSPEYNLRVTGSIIQLCGWSTYSTLLWCLKAAWLVFYIRLTEGLGRGYRLRIRIGFGFLLAGWIVVILNIFLGCRPFNHYWQINPDPGNVCHPAIADNIVWVCYSFNVATDLYLLSIPLPMLWGSRLPAWRKAGLLFLFSGGLFVIVCGTLRVYYIVSDPLNGAQLAGSWAVRETFVALVTTNLPITFTFIKGLVSPILGTITATRDSSKKYSDGTPNGLRTFGGGGSGAPSWRGRGPPTANPITNFTYSESEERIIDDVNLNNMKPSGGGSPEPGDTMGASSIQKSVEVNIVHEERPVSTQPVSGVSSYENEVVHEWYPGSSAKGGGAGCSAFVEGRARGISKH